MSTDARHDIDKRVIRTKRSIKNALFELMKTKDFTSITISELAEAANVNRRTFYTHYKSITDILDEIETELVCSIHGLISSVDASDLKSSVYKLFIDFDHLISVDFDYYFSIIRMDMRGVLTSRLKSALMESSRKLLRSSLQDSDDSAKIASAFIAGGFLNAYIEWCNSGKNVPISHAAELTSELVVCITQKYRK